MKIKTLATAITVSMPLILGGAYAQTTTTPDTGNNRSGDGGAMTTNQAPAASGSTTAPGAAGTGASTSPGAAGTGAAGTGTPGTGATGTAGTPADSMSNAPATRGASGTASDPAMQSDSAASTEAITGWSAKDDIIGKSVFNENDEKVGDIKDVVIASDGRTMYLLIGAGGFLGMGEKNVAVPFDRFQRNDDRVLLSGYSKEQLKALPEVRTQR